MNFVKFSNYNSYKNIVYSLIYFLIVLTIYEKLFMTLLKTTVIFLILSLKSVPTKFTFLLENILEYKIEENYFY